MRAFGDLLVFLAIIFLCMEVQAQPRVVWNRTYTEPGNDWASCIITGWGYYLVVGGVEHVGTYREDVLVRWVDPDGRLVWNETYSRSEYEEAHRIVDAGNGELVIAGTTWGGSPYDTNVTADTEHDIYVLKIDREGNKLWDNSYPRKYQQDDIAIARSGDGGFVLTANHYPSDVAEDWQLAYALKIDGNGNEIWERTYSGEVRTGGRNYTSVFDVAAADDGGFLLVGSCFGSDPKGDLYLLKIDANGRKAWERIYEENGTSECGYRILRTQSGGFLVAGTFVWMVDENGSIVWKRGYEGEGYHFPTGMLETWGGWVITGWQRRAGMPTQSFVMKIDENGNLTWNMTLFGGYSECIADSFEGGFMIGGFFDPDGKWETMNDDTILLSLYEGELPIPELTTIGLVALGPVFLLLERKRRGFDPTGSCCLRVDIRDS